MPLFLKGTILASSTFCRHPNNLYTARSSTQNLSSLVIFNGKFGVLKLISEFVAGTQQQLRTLRQLINHLSPFIVEEEEEVDEIEDVDMNNPTCRIYHNWIVDQPTPVFVCNIRCGTAVCDLVSWQSALVSSVFKSYAESFRNRTSSRTANQYNYWHTHTRQTKPTQMKMIGKSFIASSFFTLKTFLFYFCSPLI